MTDWLSTAVSRRQLRHLRGEASSHCARRPYFPVRRHSFIGLAVDLHEPLMRQLQIALAGNIHAIFSRQHALIAFQAVQARRRFLAPEHRSTLESMNNPLSLA